MNTKSVLHISSKPSYQIVSDERKEYQINAYLNLFPVLFKVAYEKFKTVKTSLYKV